MKRSLKSIPDFNEILKNPSPNLKVPVYDLSKEGRQHPVNTTKKYTLNQVGDAVMELTKIVKGIANDVTVLKKDVKGINTRLDYIVSANNLKDLPKSKQ